jgi:hypothetical protein
LRCDNTPLIEHARKEAGAILSGTVNSDSSPRQQSHILCSHAHEIQIYKLLSVFDSDRAIETAFNFQRRLLWVGVCCLLLGTMTNAQKIKVGYDKSIDFSKYKTYSWMKEITRPVYPMLATTVFGTVDQELKKKGLQGMEEGHGEIVLQYSGGIGFGLNQTSGAPIIPTYLGQPISTDATMWTGNTFGGSASTAVPEGWLMLELLDIAAKKIVWRGEVRGKLDIERKNESLDHARKAVIKLLKDFPPRKKK